MSVFVRLLVSMTKFKINILITIEAASLLNFKLLFMQNLQPFWPTQCPDLCTCFHSLLQVDYICGLMKGIVNKGTGGDFDTAPENN